MHMGCPPSVGSIKLQVSFAEYRHTPQHAATHCNTLQRTATHCNTLQHTATHRNTLQRTATQCNTHYAFPMPPPASFPSLPSLFSPSLSHARSRNQIWRRAFHLCETKHLCLKCEISVGGNFSLVKWPFHTLEISQV